MGLYKDNYYTTHKKWWMLKDTEDKKIIGQAEGDRDIIISSMEDVYERACEYHYTFYKEDPRFIEIAPYQHMDLLGSNSYSSSSGFMGSKIVDYNVIKSAINSAHNKLSKLLPKITFLTQNKPHYLRQIAKELDIWMFNVMKKGMAYDEFQKAFLSACIYNYGVVKIIDTKDGYRFKALDPFSFFVDDPLRGCSDKDQMGDVEMLKLYQVIEMYPEHEENLKKKHGEDLDEMVAVTEMYKKMGARIIFTDSVLLKFEKWNHDRLPYISVDWNYRPTGFVGSGIAEEGLPYQKRITYILKKVSLSLNLNCNPKVAIRKGSGIAKSELTNRIAEIIEFNETPPEYLTPPAVSNQVIEILREIKNTFFEQIGMSEMYLTGKLPRGLSAPSGTALTNYHDIESERFQIVRQRYENCFIESAKYICEVSKDKKLPNNLKGIDLKEELGSIEIYPSSIIPNTPYGQSQKLTELVQSGIATPDDLLSHMDAPDLKRLASSKVSRMEAIELEIERALEEGRPIEIDPILGNMEMLEKARKIYAETKKDRISTERETRTLLLSQFIEALTAQIEQEQMQIMEQENQQIQNQERALQMQKEQGKTQE